jgi:S1-C subfamily serine protease
VKWVVPELIAHHKLRRPSLGLELATPQVSRRLGVDGVLVLAVQPGGAADRAGILPTRRTRDGDIELGDVIVALEDTETRSNNDVTLALERRTPGDEVELTVARGGRTVKVRVKLDAYE